MFFSFFLSNLRKSFGFFNFLILFLYYIVSFLGLTAKKQQHVIHEFQNILNSYRIHSLNIILKLS